VRLLEALVREQQSRTQSQDAALKGDLLSANHELGLAQYRSGNLLAALATFSRALQLAEAGAGGTDGKHALALCNLSVGEVLLRNGETDAAVGKLRKAVELYGEFAGATAALRDNTPAGYERALRQIAASAPLDRRMEMEADLAPFLK
jgi:tetratricopeptide (TPR) repeat protein